MKVEVPVWGYVIGIIMIFFGGCSTLNNKDSIYTPEVIEKTETEIDSFYMALDSLERNSIYISDKDTLRTEELDGFKTIMKDTVSGMVSFSDHYKRWVVIFGYIGIILSLLYIVGGIFLMVIRKFSIMIAYSALIAYITFGIVQMVVLSLGSNGGLVGISIIFDNLFGVFLDVGILIAVIACDKTVYRSVMKEEKTI
jgi:Na+-translocating ferredoxin:NAD+ oxidoreductase RnfD subunit